MKNKAFPWAIRIVALLSLAAGTGALAQLRTQQSFVE